MHTEDTVAQAHRHDDIRVALCDVGGVLIHKRRSPELQQWEHILQAFIPITAGCDPTTTREERR